MRREGYRHRFPEFGPIFRVRVDHRGGSMANRGTWHRHRFTRFLPSCYPRAPKKRSSPPRQARHRCRHTRLLPNASLYDTLYICMCVHIYAYTAETFANERTPAKNCFPGHMSKNAACITRSARRHSFSKRSRAYANWRTRGEVTKVGRETYGRVQTKFHGDPFGEGWRKICEKNPSLTYNVCFVNLIFP